MKKSSGFTTVEGLVVALVVVALFAVGFYVANNKSSSTPASTATTASSATPVPTNTVPAPQINNASDLTKAMADLNATSVSSNNSDNTQLTNEASAF